MNKRIIVGLETKTSPRGFKIFEEFSWTETLKTGFFTFLKKPVFSISVQENSLKIYMKLYIWGYCIN